MRVGIMTFHRAHNCGAALQAWALARTIGRLGCACEIIDYRCAQIERITRRFFKSGRSRRAALGALAHLPRRTLRAHRFAAFRKRLPLSAPADAAGLERAAARYDRIVAGSDQVWNLKRTGGDRAYFLEFAAPQKRCAYAPSFGRDAAAPDARALEAVRAFRALSAREEAGAALLARMTGREAARVPDPVLLVDAGEWRALAGGRAGGRDYLFVYVISRQSPQMQSAIEALCAREGLEARIFQQSMQRGAPGRYRRALGPREFLRQLAGARYVLTDSFHATAFSILLHRNFHTFITAPGRTADERISTLLATFGLTDRLVVPGDSLPDWTREPDFAAADAALAAERERGLAFLRSFCEEDA